MVRKLFGSFAVLALVMSMMATFASGASAAPQTNSANNSTRCNADDGVFSQEGSTNYCTFEGGTVVVAQNRAGQSNNFFTVSETTSDTVVIKGTGTGVITGGESTGVVCTNPGGDPLGDGALQSNPNCSQF